MKHRIREVKDWDHRQKKWVIRYRAEHKCFFFWKACWYTGQFIDYPKDCDTLEKAKKDVADCLEFNNPPKTGKIHEVIDSRKKTKKEKLEEEVEELFKEVIDDSSKKPETKIDDLPLRGIWD